jgi:hypothetical protein
MNVRLVLFCCLMSVFTTTGAAGDKVSINVSPPVAFAPANLTIRTVIEAAPENQAVNIAVESTDFYRSSEVGLDGDRAPRTTTLEFRGLPTGNYEVKATLLGPGGRHLAMARQQVHVISTPRGDTERN